jgi:GNAT superfamily N-acetyltransferase
MGDVRFRRPTEADYVRIVRVVEDWWPERHVDTLLPRLWLQHFTGTSWVVEDEAGRLAGFLVGFVSPDDPTTAYCHLIACDPNHRRHGIGRHLYEHFFDDARAAGASRVAASTWPGNRIAVAFHRALGFELSIGPGTQNLYGSPAYPGYDFDREDRVVFTRRL